MAEREEDLRVGRLWSAVKQQKGKLYIIRKCIAMLICGRPMCVYASCNPSILHHLIID
ncbi:hypothetical protein BAE44_0023174 [Dichanthelium oligosanthes]|uniref:Uncharacterized protein n=1 Tax=Dichanthelium oligosanthes TaxID=888268 RepID=A0A1E5USE8_9POAL|nr:hypothetical protein BAE44_0023174 [Dichanthelium oligosanthes]